MKTVWLHIQRVAIIVRSALLRVATASGLGPLPLVTILVTIAFVVTFALATCLFSLGVSLVLAALGTTVFAAFCWPVIANKYSLEDLYARSQSINEELGELRRARQRRMLQETAEIKELPPGSEVASIAQAAPTSASKPSQSCAKPNPLSRVLQSMAAAVNGLVNSIGVFFLTLAYKKETKRDQNECWTCGHTWFPRGKSISRTCPDCGSANVGLAHLRGATATGWFITIVVFAIGIYVSLQPTTPTDPASLNGTNLAAATADEDTRDSYGLPVRPDDFDAPDQGVDPDHAPNIEQRLGQADLDEHPITAPPGTPYYEVVRIIDGDTFEVLADEMRITVELADVDCPEIDQPFGKRALRITSNAIRGHRVKIAPRGFGVGSIVGVVTLPNGKDLGRELTKSGMAWVTGGGSATNELKESESLAKAEQRGLWDDESPIAPWEWRAGKRPAIAQNADKPNTGSRTAGPIVPRPVPRYYWLNTSSYVRHNSGCKYFGRTRNGRLCGPYNGRPCQICGG